VFGLDNPDVRRSAGLRGYLPVLQDLELFLKWIVRAFKSLRLYAKGLRLGERVMVRLAIVVRESGMER